MLLGNEGKPLSEVFYREPLTREVLLFPRIRVFNVSIRQGEVLSGLQVTLCFVNEPLSGVPESGVEGECEAFSVNEEFPVRSYNITTGSYTPEGFAAFKGKLPMAKGYTEDSAPSYGSMNFVADWDNRWVEL